MRISETLQQMLRAESSQELEGQARSLQKAQKAIPELSQAFLSAGSI